MIVYRNLSRPQVGKLARELAKTIVGKKATIGLIGPLGAGKTTFIKAFAKALKIDKISSPTFVITHQYNLGTQHLYHIDLYRLNNYSELEPIGLKEILAGNNIVLIEWADKFPKVARSCDILIILRVKPGNKRDVIIKSN